MAGNKKPRKKHRPSQSVLPIVYRFNQKAELTLKLVPHEELDALVKGDASERSFHTLAARLNLGATCVRWYWPENKEANDLVNQSLDAITSVRDRAEKTGKWGVTGDEFRIIGEALNLADDTQEELTRKQIDKALTYVLEKAGI